MKIRTNGTNNDVALDGLGAMTKHRTFVARWGPMDDSLHDAEIALKQDRQICPECGVSYLEHEVVCQNCGHALEFAPAKHSKPQKKFLSRIRRLFHIRR